MNSRIYYSSVPVSRQQKTIDDIPPRLLVEWGAKLYSLTNLTWTYVETICDLCVQMQLDKTKQLVRTVRTLKRDYDRFRWSSMGTDGEADEAHRGEAIEQTMNADLDRLFNGLELEVKKLGLSQDYTILVIAVQQALTLMDAVRIYARWCDSEFHKRGVWVDDCCMVQKEFLALYAIIPQFAGDCYRPDMESRKLTAKIIENKLQEIEVRTI